MQNKTYPQLNEKMLFILYLGITPIYQTLANSTLGVLGGK
jgi:hypothetical protein